MKKVYLLIIAASILVIVFEGYQFFAAKKTNITACTQEAKICPDGSAVGRTAPNCEFAQCPAPAGQTGCSTNSDCRDGATCMTEGPLIANQPIRRVCVPKGQVVPL